MSRSKRKTPKTNVCSCKAGAMKWWKKCVNRKMRRQLSDYDKVNCNKDRLKFGTQWQAPNDGKVYWGDELDIKDRRK